MGLRGNAEEILRGRTTERRAGWGQSLDVTYNTVSQGDIYKGMQRACCWQVSPDGYITLEPHTGANHPTIAANTEESHEPVSHLLSCGL